jgi:cytochrome bd ubiquinol oxidase subunit II
MNGRFALKVAIPASSIFGRFETCDRPERCPFPGSEVAGAAPPSSLAFMFWGEGLFVFPLLLLYTAISYGVFRGKVRATDNR